MNLSVAIPGIQSALSLSKSQIGLIGSVLFWVYGVGQLINGYIGDRLPSRLFVFIGLAVAGLANVLFGLSGSFVLLIVLWAFNGYFQSMLWGPISKTLSVWFAHEKRNKVAIALSTSMVAGYLMAWGVGGRLLALAGWRWVFLAPGALILLFAPLWLLLGWSHPNEAGLESPNRQALPQENNTEPQRKLSLLAVIGETRLWYVVIACLAQGLIKEGIGLWGPTFLMESNHIDMASVTMLLLFIPLMNFAGMMLAGWLNALFRHQEKLASAVLFGLGLISVAGLLLAGRASTALSLLLLGMASASVFGVNTLLLGVLPLGYARYNKVSSVAGFLDFCSYMAAGAASVVSGALAGAFGWNSVIGLWVAAAAVGAGALLLNWRRDRSQKLLASAAIAQ